MTTLTLREGAKPSETIIQAANAVATVTDATGRSISIKRMNALDRLRMFEAVGSENVKNEAYLGYATLAFHVASIDGDSILKPANKLQLEGLIQRLGDDGLSAVALGIGEHFTAGTSGDFKDAVGNG
ncbi:MAG: hypothetical protein M0006_10215 [Magnetospirillum sp.]|nr:hypothetical protein [Magnetospirillum sp.]